MKSKTSSFNTTIFKKNLTHYWPIWIVYLCYLIVVVPLSIWLYANNESNYIGNVPLTQKQYYVIGSALAGAGSVIPWFLLQRQRQHLQCFLIYIIPEMPI